MTRSQPLLARRDPAVVRPLAGLVGGAAALIGLWQTGLVATVPAAMGLTTLAASDLTSHRFSLRTLRFVGALVAVGLVVDAARASAWDRLITATAIACAVLLLALASWFATSGIALGDVLLLTFAVLVPAWLSARSAAATALVAVAVGGAVAAVQRHRRSPGRVPGSVALGPALLVGWLVAVVVG